jgi:hypothetical protein
MSRKIRKSLAVVVVAFGIYILYSQVMLFIPRRGTADSVSALKTVYNKAGAQIGATFTNSHIQSFPFDGRIDWTLMFFKDTVVVLVGKVDTNALRQFIASHPDTRFIWSGANHEIEEGWPSGREHPTATWTNIWFRTDGVVEGFESIIEGQIAFPSCIGTVRSFGSDQPISAYRK